MKLNKLLPIVALTGVTSVAMPLVACSTGGGDTPEPVEKTMTIKTTQGANLPGAIKTGSSVVIAAFNEEGNQIDGATFATTSTTIKLSGAEVTAQEPGEASITCTAPGYTEAKWDFIVTTEIGPWDEFNKISETSMEISVGAYDMKNGKTYSASYHIDDETDADYIMFVVTNDTTDPFAHTYDFISKENCSLEIDGNPIGIDYLEESGVAVIMAAIDESCKGKDLNFTVTCVSDYDTAYLVINLPS